MSKKSANWLDKWIIASNHQLLEYFRNELDNYRLYSVVHVLLKFLDDLTKGYIKLTRSRMKGDQGLDEMQLSLNTLFDVLLLTS